MTEVLVQAIPTGICFCQKTLRVCVISMTSNATVAMRHRLPVKEET